MKIALYLDLFEFFNENHLKCIKCALDDFKMDTVVIIPSMKDSNVSIDKRINSIRTTLYYNKIYPLYPYNYLTYIYNKNKTIKIDKIEELLIPPYYQYATFHALKNKYCNDEIFILCKKKTIEDISDWMNGEQIIKDYNFIIVSDNILI